MRRFAVLLVLGLSAGAARAAPPELERGRYVVEQVGLCADCHAPRDAAGAPAGGLIGAPIGFAPTHPMPVWAEYAPRLAGLPPGYDAASLARYLQTGLRPDGTSSRPPMPPYRLDAADAAAVVAYLAALAR